ncbi:MAG: hypothetical protein VR70_16985 [Rhodospirillaceae bacterium BRH_c57]|nr:MAG: hypothetical protein VR70_16985 [Rhodospirillaceae bacterium BRH_c57]
MPFDRLRTLLLKEMANPTGPAGFEGLLRDVLTAVTGQSFGLMKSGPQGGVDVLQRQAANRFTVALESKRYKGKNPPLDELKYKVVEAARSFPGLDLWLLGTTREIKENDRRALEAVGEEDGIAVEILDWPQGPDSLPPLAVLFAAADHVTATHLSNAAAKVGGLLDAVRQHPRYEAERARLLDRLTRPDVGYAAARRRLIDWTRDALSETTIARNRLGSHANLLEQEVKRICRPVPEAKLEAWWNEKHYEAAAILGDEGTGKTWATLEWWLTRADTLPLTLFASARDVQQAQDPFDLMSELLARRTELRTPAFWRKRLRLWQGAGMELPHVLLIIDGLNEHFTYRDWRTLLGKMLSKDMGRQYAVAVTCRPDHWRTALKGLADLQPPPREIVIEGFDDKELDELLRMHGLTRTDFSPDVLHLMRTPRLSGMAIQSREELRASGDVTASRLVMEDWQRRLRLHGERLAPTTEEFRAWVTRLGRTAHESLKSGQEHRISRQEVRTELQSEMGRDDDLSAALSEIIDGRWLAPVSGTNRFKLDTAHAPYCLALVLVDQAARTDTAEAADERIAQFLEPLRGHDIGVSILRAATAIALREPECSHHAKRRLAERWLVSQNFSNRDFAELWRLIPEAPDLFCALAEELWLEKAGGFLEDEAVIKAFANASEAWPHVAAVVQGWVTGWLGTYWLDPDQGAYLNRYDGDTDRARQNRAATEERARQWAEISDGLPEIRHREQAGLSWLCHRLPAIISYLPRRPFAPALLSWAISRAAMGRARHFEEIAWCLRNNPIDAEETAGAVLEAAERLLALDHPIARDAARNLLEALATPAAMAKVALRPTVSHRQWPDTVQVDEVTRVVSWDHQSATQWPRSQEVALAAAAGLSAPARDPHTVLPEEDRTVLKGLPDTLAVEQVWGQFGTTSEDIELKSSQAALARWAPEALADLFRRTFGTAVQRDEEGIRQIARRLPPYLMVLDPAQLEPLSVQETLPGNEGRDRAALAFLLLARLWQRPPAAQITVLASVPDGVFIKQEHHRVLLPVNADDLRAALRHLESAQTIGRILGWLWYLTLVPLKNFPVDSADALLQLCGHAEASVRRLALRVVSKTQHPALLEAFVGSGWHYASGMDREEGAWASLILCAAATDETVSNISHRIDPQALGHLLILRPDSSEAIEGFANFLRQHLDHQCNRRTESRTVPSFWANGQKTTEAVGILLNRRGDEVVSWLTPLLEGGEHVQWSFMNSFPVVPLTAALLQTRPDVGARLCLALRDGIMQLPEFETLPLRGAEHEAVWKARDVMLARAKTDRALAHIAAEACVRGAQEWLLQCLARDLAQEADAGRMARAMTLAGFSDSSPAMDRFWAEHLAQPPASGWLANVHAWSRSQYQRNQWARHWLTGFFNEPDRDRAFGQHQLFMSCADRRAWSWASEMLHSRKETVPGLWEQHLSLSSAALEQRIEDQEKKLEETLYGTKIEKILSPWH